MERMKTNGEILSLHRTKRVRVVPNLKIENRDGYCYLMLGDQEPELAMQMTASNCRALAEAVTKHAEQLEKDSPVIFLPGGIPS